MLEMFLEERLVNVVAIADTHADAPGLKLARQHQIATFTGAVEALEHCRQYPDCIVYNLSHDDAVAVAAERIFGGKRVAGGTEVKLFWQMVMNLKQVKLELEKSQHQLQSIIHNVMDGIITLDESGHIEGFNPAAEKIFGYAEQDIRGPTSKCWRLIWRAERTRHLPTGRDRRCSKGLACAAMKWAGCAGAGGPFRWSCPCRRCIWAGSVISSASCATSGSANGQRRRSPIWRITIF
ncbi:hypothetical protein UT5_20210 [Ferrigenium sp. UT5]